MRNEAKGVYLVVRSSDKIWQDLWYALLRRAQLISNFSQRVTETSPLMQEENKVLKKKYLPTPRAN